MYFQLLRDWLDLMPAVFRHQFSEVCLHPAAGLVCVIVLTLSVFPAFETEVMMSALIFISLCGFEHGLSSLKNDFSKETGLISVLLLVFLGVV